MRHQGAVRLSADQTGDDLSVRQSSMRLSTRLSRSPGAAVTRMALLATARTVGPVPL